MHPVLLATAEHLARHGELVLSDQIREELRRISRATLARRLKTWRSPKSRKKTYSQSRALSHLRSQVPIETYRWDEQKPGALEIDLVEHNGGSAIGHFAYTLTVVDVVTGYSRRRAFLGKSQKVVFEALTFILSEWPFQPWGLHSDNGSEFLNSHLRDIRPPWLTRLNTPSMPSRLASSLIFPSRLSFCQGLLTASARRRLRRP